MTFGEHSSESSLTAIYRDVGKLNQEWQAEFGLQQGDGWIPGAAIVQPDHPPFSRLLERIGEVVGSTDRRVVAVAFVVRMAWSAGAAIAPYMMRQCVPDIRLSNVSLRFSDNCLFRKLSIHRPRAVMLPLHNRARDGIEFLEYARSAFESADQLVALDAPSRISPDSRLRGALRRVLLGQSIPVLRSLHRWSNSSKRTLWEQFTVSWSIQFIAVQNYLERLMKIARWCN